MTQQKSDPYTLSSESIKEPPSSIAASIKYLGPGMILSASIVGSGELIATTTLGAKAGFVTLWVILVSCLCKVAIQLEFGKEAISSGKPTFVSFLSVPGPRWKGGHWIMWVWLFIMPLKFIQEGGILGGVALTMNIIFPGLGVNFWVWFIVVSCAIMVGRGYYNTIQQASIIMIGLFSITTVASLFFLQYTPHAITTGDILSGLSFQLPIASVGFAIAAFGITGVGGDEIMAYVYWCVEKGYAKFTGPKSDDPAWERRARGWIKVMYLDAFVSMLVYTTVTAAFYLLGAAVLNNRGEIPLGYDMIETLSRLYTESLGPGAKYIFLFGSFIVLFSTLYAAVAAWSRLFGDAFGCFGWLNYYDEKARQKFVQWFAWIGLALMAILFHLFKEPVFMVVLGGIATSAILMFVLLVAYWYRYHMLDKRLLPSRLYDAALWISIITICVLAARGLYLSFLKMVQ